MRGTLWQVGELARQTGLSVRTLHYYEEVGLLTPSGRTEAGYRLYSEADVARLQQIKSLRQVGFALEEIRACLGNPNFSSQRVLQLHLARLREQIELQQRLCRRLEAIAARFGSAEAVSAEEFLRAIEEMTMLEKYYTPEQLEELRQRGEQFSEDQIRAFEAEWQELIAQVRAEMEKGTDPASEPVRRLARRWGELVNAFTGGNPGIEQSLKQMWHEEETIHGLDTRAMRELGEYLARGKAAPQDPL
jgi:DNA-binding transcriptional MerR regulator